MTKHEFKVRARGLLNPIVGLLASLGVPPMLVSLFGLALSLYGAVVVADGSLFLGAVFLVLSGLCDVLDGDLARRKNLTSTFGAFADSTFDRITEFAYFCAIVVYVVNRPGEVNNFALSMVLIALSSSQLTSYTRARAEGVGLDCKVGIMERPERIALLFAGLVLGYYVLIIVMTILAATTTITVVQRILHVYRVSKPGADDVAGDHGADPRGADTNGADTRSADSHGESTTEGSV